MSIVSHLTIDEILQESNPSVMYVPTFNHEVPCGDECDPIPLQDCEDALSDIDEETFSSNRLTDLYLTGQDQSIVFKQMCSPEAGGQPRSSVRRRLLPPGLSDVEFYRRALELTHPMDQNTQIPSLLKAVIDHNKVKDPDLLNEERRSMTQWIRNKALELKGENQRIFR